ncbi:hypothetical protein Tco_0254087, partial [Tanacetum coccineum]
VEEAIVGDTVVGDNFAISIRNVVFENVVVPKANDIVVVETDDKIDIVVVVTDNVVVDIVGMSGVILEACVGAMECGSLEVVDSNTQKPNDPEQKIYLPLPWSNN